jgi:hypothetical protein
MRPLICLLVWLFVSCHLSASEPRKTTSLNGEWKFRRDDQKDWKLVTLPTHWETHEGLKFDGIGWYEKTLPAITLPPGRRLLLHFDAVATQATVYWNDTKLGDHLGAWTPFRFDVTEQVRRAGSVSDRSITIRIRVDEKVGHNTQGFLPIIAPHFGGVWQGVKLIEVPETYIDDLDIVVRREVVRFPVKGSQPVNSVDVTMDTFNPSTQEGEVFTFGSGTPADRPLVQDGHIQLKRDWPPKDRGVWSPTTPTTFRVKLKLSTGDAVTTTAGFRNIETKGDQFLLNGQPLSIRGVLNWGYYPPSLAPTPSEEQWRSDLRLIKSWGFNLMKCCLWVPPKRLLEIADEEGVLIWLEYPTWHPKLTPQYRDELMREYREFHQHDRNHPSVILRSLTCETGPGADLKVIQDLYDQCKRMCGGLVVDDSSWIQWNRVCDFYDDHPYGNNHTWVATLTRLKDYIAKSKLGVKPLCLGEAIAADTWVPTKPMLDAIAKAKADPKQAWSLDERGYPYWVPGFFDANRKWVERMSKVCGYPIEENDLERSSRYYARRMREFQIKTYRREVPNGGYVVSVLRDFPLASMGLVDYLGKPKWERDDWVWHKDPAILIHLKDDRIGYDSVAEGMVEIISEQPRQGKLTLQLGYDNNHVFREKTFDFKIDRPVVTHRFEYSFDWGPFTNIRGKDSIRAILEGTSVLVEAHPIFIPRPAQDLPAAVWYGMEPLPGTTLTSKRTHDLLHAGSAVVLTNKINVPVMDFLEAGGHVLLLPDGSTNSLPLRDHWFLRGGPFVNDFYQHSVDSQFLQFLPRLQHFDLAGKVVPDVEYLEEIDPIYMLWDNHDIKTVKTHGVLFATRVGKGKLLVSALNHSGEKNAAGHYFLGELIRVAKGISPRNTLKPETIARLRAKLNEKKLDLTKLSWQFQPDGKNEGLTRGWHMADFDDRGWKPIKIGQHWEGQGHAALDGWAWYRLKVDVPKDWPAQGLYVNTEGVDDAYELYVNGSKIGAGGDIPNKQTAFEERKSHPIPANLLKPGEKNSIAIRVHDWYGAGGIHRPMTLSNIPLGGVNILR